MSDSYLQKAIDDLCQVAPAELDERIIVDKVCYDFEENSNRKIIDQITLRDFISDLETDIIDHYKYILGNKKYYDSQAFTTWGNFVGFVQDVYSNGDTFLVGIYTFKEYEKKEQEARRIELEGIASQFAQKCKHPVGSMEFLEALNEAINHAEQDYENYNNPERQMEEWMDHRAAGSSSYFHENVNYTRSKLYDEVNTLQDVWNWLEKNCPLLMCQWLELQRVEA